MFKAILPLFLFASEAPSNQSELVEKGHAHVWQAIQSNGKSEAWIDSNWKSTIRHKNQAYPVFLLRSLAPFGNTQILLDFKLAFDCSGQKIAMLEVWAQTEKDTQGQKFTNDIKFETSKDPSSDQLFAVACGTPLAG